MKRNITQALNSQPAPPCDIFDCENKPLCASRHLACRAFGFYLSSAAGRFSGAPMFREPDGIIYEKIFKDDQC